MKVAPWKELLERRRQLLLLGTIIQSGQAFVRCINAENDAYLIQTQFDVTGLKSYFSVVPSLPSTVEYNCGEHNEINPLSHRGYYIYFFGSMAQIGARPLHC
jgi:hypothetical protein